VSQAWLEQRERGSILGVRLMVAIAFFLGRPTARWILYPVCLYFLLFSVKSRRASRKYLSRALGRPPRFADLFRHYLTFATVALDRFFLLKDRHDLFQIRIHGEQILQQTLDRGQGCLLLGAHLGSFEILRAAGTSHHIDVRMVMYEDNARKVNAIAKAVNPAFPHRIITLGRFDSMFKVHERLQESAWVGILGDRTLEDGDQLQALFLGEVALFPAAPYRMALMLKRPIVFMTGLYRGGNHYELHFEKLFDPDGVSRSARAAAVEEALHRYSARLEHYCREAPYNWFNFYDFWDTGARKRSDSRQTDLHAYPEDAHRLDPAEAPSAAGRRLGPADRTLTGE
jgi:predicted LPLAT superfamily acyltransferase